MLDRILRDTARKSPAKVSFYFGEEQVTFHQLDQDVDRLAQGLLDLGLEPQARVAVILGNSTNLVRSYLGVIRAKGVVVPINPLFKSEELKYLIKDSDIKFIITSQASLAVIASIQNELPDLKNIIVVGGTKEGIILPFEELMAKEAAPVELDIQESDLAACQYTSGTSGKPKGALLTHGNLLFAMHSSILRTGMGKEDHSLCVLPLFHIFSQFTNMLMPIYLGASVTILPQFIPGVVLKEVETKKVSFLCAVPGMYAAILALLSQNPSYDLSSLRVCISGGAALPLELYNRFLEVCKVDLIEGSGPTEAVSFVGVPGSNKPGSVGRPLEGVQAKIVDDNDVELPQGEIGEICVQGPTTMQGYQNLPEATAEAMRGGWFHTGDLGKMDQDGFVYIVDRKKDMIIVGGMNVYPREIEECLYQHPKVYETAVIGAYDKERGQVPRAYVVLKADTEADAKEFILYCRKHLANYKCPKDVVIVESLPKNATGKIDKKRIQ